MYVWLQSNLHFWVEFALHILALLYIWLACLSPYQKSSNQASATSKPTTPSPYHHCSTMLVMHQRPLPYCALPRCHAISSIAVAVFLHLSVDLHRLFLTMNIPKNCSTSYSTYLTRLICIICVQTIRDVFRVKWCFYLSDVTVEASVLCAVERSHFWGGEARGKNFARLLRKFYESNNEDNSGTASSNSSNNPINVININVLVLVHCTLSISGTASSISSNNPINIININVLCTCTLSIWTNCYVFQLSYRMPKVVITSNKIKLLLNDINTLLALLRLVTTQGDGSKASSLLPLEFGLSRSLHRQTTPYFHRFGSTRSKPSCTSSKREYINAL
jgi:hypothetical protein